MFTSTCNSPSSLNFPASLGLPAAVPACSSLTSRAISSHFPVPRLLGSPSSSSQGVRNSGRREWLDSVVVVEDRRRDSVACRVGMVGESDFGEEVLGSDLPILVEFVADWCGPCRLMSPTVDWASEEYKGKLKVVKIDHDQNPKLIQDYKVFGLPTFILFKNGQEVPESRREGAITKIKLKEYIDNLLESITVS